MLDTKELLNDEVENLDDARYKIDYIDQRITEVRLAMRREGSIPAWQKLDAERDDLKAARANIVSQARKLHASRQDARAAVQEDELQQDGRN